MRCKANRLWIGSLAGALVVACGDTACASQAPVPVPSKTAAQVAGAIVDAKGMAITGAHVTVIDSMTGQKFTTTSDSRGFFQFANLVPGDLELTAELSGFSSVRQSLAVRPGATTALTMRFASGPVPVTGPSPIVLPDVTVLDLTLDGPAVSELLRSEAMKQLAVSSIVGLAERRSLFVFEKSVDAAFVYEMVPVKRPLSPAELQSLLTDRAGMRLVGVHWLSADSSVAVFRHGR